eukprot:jgi/Tetstr1/439916/TSEL_028323.t1
MASRAAELLTEAGVLGDAALVASWAALYLAVALLRPGTPLAVLKNVAHKVEWDTRMVSTVHAMVIAAGACVVFYEAIEYTRHDMMFGYAVYPVIFSKIFRAYLAYDLVLCVAYYHLLKDWASIVHHVIFLSICQYAIGNYYFKFPFAWLSIAEVSTPFVNLRWQMAICGDKSSALYKLNAGLLTLTFFVTRVVMYGAGLVHLYIIRDVWYGPETPVGMLLCVTGMALGYLLNLFWFRLVAKGFFKLMAKPSPEKQQ